MSDSQVGVGPVHVLREAVLLPCPLAHTFPTASGRSGFKCSLPDSEPGFDAWSLTSQGTGLTTKVFGDEVLQISLLLNTQGFVGEGTEPCVSLARAVTTKLLSHSHLLFTPIHFLYVLDILGKKNISFSCFAKHEFWLKS